MQERKALIIGNGAREHAIAWRLSQALDTVFIAPGNAGTENVGTNLPIETTDFDSLIRFAKKNKITLTVVGPEDPLGKGIVNVFTKEGLSIFGPTMEAARLETDKAFAISFMQEHNIPHPQSIVFNDPNLAREFVIHPRWKRFVIKASGLALGKGVFLPDTLEEANEAIDQILVKKVFNQDDNLIIQERLEGQEISLLAISDGKTIIPFLPTQDHKRIFDGDKGPNTGGMGAYGPATIMTPQLLHEAYAKILKPTIDGMRKEGIPFKGILFAGLMLTKDGLKVLEYNVRFGDPETQVLMMLFGSDLAKALQASINGTLTQAHVNFREGASTSVVLASAGYPGLYDRGEVIYGLNTVKDSDIQIFHSGTANKNGNIVTNGGRVIAVTAYKPNLQLAIQAAYGEIGQHGIHFNGMQYRHDIGYNAR